MFHAVQASRNARPMPICQANVPGRLKVMHAYTPTTQLSTEQTTGMYRKVKFQPMNAARRGPRNSSAYATNPSCPVVRAAKRARVRPPNMMVVAASSIMATPSVTLPPVAMRMLSDLKKMPDPMQMPTIRQMAVNSE